MNTRILAVAAILFALAVSAASAQSIVAHGAPSLAAPKGNFFYRVNADGAKILVNRSPLGKAEELVEIPRDGTSEKLWFRSTGRSIYNRIAVSGDGGKVAFAHSPGSRVYVLSQALGTPLSIANVDPDGDIRQLVLSHDGKLAAFTASRYKENGKLVRVRANLYVAATDGSKVYKVTSAPVFEKFIPFALSGDGKAVVWVDDPAKGPLVAGVDGQNAQRLSAAPEGWKIQAVFCDTTAAKICYQAIGSGGVKLYAVDRSNPAQPTVTQWHSAAHGFYELASVGSTFLLCQFNAGQPGRGGWWTWDGTKLVKQVSCSMPRHLGSWAFSADCGTMVWRDRKAAGGLTTYVWRSTAP